MKIHFMGDPRGDKNIYAQIIEAIEEQGHEVVSRHILERSQEEVDRESEQDEEKYVKESKRWIMRADAVVFEVYQGSVSIGFEIATALYHYKKPVIVLCHTSSNPVVNSLKGVRSERLQLLAYDDSTLLNVLRQALDFAAESADVRFNFLITPSMAHYLEWVAALHKQPRSVYLRELIAADMEDNEEYENDRS